jgi:hypothetical protein
LVNERKAAEWKLGVPSFRDKERKGYTLKECGGVLDITILIKTEVMSPQLQNSTDVEVLTNS